MVKRTVLFIFSVMICAAMFSMGTAWAGPPNPGQGDIMKVAQNAYPPPLDWQATMLIAKLSLVAYMRPTQAPASHQRRVVANWKRASTPNRARSISWMYIRL